MWSKVNLKFIKILYTNYRLTDIVLHPTLHHIDGSIEIQSDNIYKIEIQKNKKNIKVDK